MALPVFSNLDIVITRSCQLNCQGCLVFSDHNLVQGHLKVEDSLNALEFWSNHLQPRQINLFGGEPLMHPDLLSWVEPIHQFFVVNKKPKPNISLQTNGLKIATYDIDILRTLINDYNVGISISVHSKEGWYTEKINQGIEVLQSIIGGTLKTNKNTDLGNVERFYENDKNNWFNLIDQTLIPWTRHYNGFAGSLAPDKEFDSDFYPTGHGYCEAKEFVQLYNGMLYKCPTMATLDDTLKRYNYPNKDMWDPWLKYKPLTVDAADDEIQSWFETQSKPEKYCNMCFGDNSKMQVLHTLKIKQK